MIKVVLLMSLIGVLVVSEVSAEWRPNNHAECWKSCGEKGGPCPNFCGHNAYCCRKGWGGCPAGAAEVSPSHRHICVYPIVWGLKNNADCWKGCGEKAGSCPNFCGHDYCCRKGWGGCPAGATEVSQSYRHTCMKTYHRKGEYIKTTSISLDDGYWGKWGNEETCKYPYFVNKMELKIESRQGGGDDTALNAIRLTCSDGRTISSTQEQWGTWRGARNCHRGFINTATIRRERKQSRGKDDSGGNGIRFRCTDGSKHYPGDGYWGYWSPWDSCHPGSAVYGIQTRVERKRKRNDDTALNDVRFLCAKLP